MSKILIINSKYDEPAERIIEWFIYLKNSFIRYCFEDEAISTINSSINQNNYKFDFYSEISKNSKVSCTEIKNIYYRNGGFNFNWDVKNNSIHPLLDDKVEEYYNDELTSFLNYLFDNTVNNILGNYNERRQNKLINLFIAQKNGLDIPDTVVLTKKNDLIKFKKKNIKIINKPIFEIFFKCTGGHQYKNYVEEVDDTTIENMQDSFFPQLFQEKIDKKYELRIFFLEKTLWVNAIFNNNEEVDWRESGNKRAFVRQFPYKLSKQIELNLLKFIDYKKMNIGTIDMIVSKENKFYFLEVNPLGQYANLSRIGNYFIEKQIAEMLIQ